jgi:hypothetical protein
MSDDISELSWEAQEVFKAIKSFGRMPGSGIQPNQLLFKVGKKEVLKKGIPELETAGPITGTGSGEPTLTDKGYRTSL